MPRRTRLTQDLIEAIADRVCAGAFPYVAAKACGIPKSTFYARMQKGEHGRGLYRESWDKVQLATGEARTAAETRVHRDKPLEWLRLGPGRERVDEAGWTEGPQTLRVEGGEVPLQIGHSRGLPLPENQLVEFLQIFEGMVWIAFTEFGRAAFLDASVDEAEEEAAEPHLQLPG